MGDNMALVLGMRVLADRWLGMEPVRVAVLVDMGHDVVGEHMSNSSSC